MYTIQWRFRFTKVLSPVCTLYSEGSIYQGPVSSMYTIRWRFRFTKVLSPVCSMSMNTCCWSLVDSSLIDNMLICWDRLCVQGRMNKLGFRIQCLEWIDGVTSIGGGVINTSRVIFLLPIHPYSLYPSFQYLIPILSSWEYILFLSYHHLIFSNVFLTFSLISFFAI